MKRSKRVKTAKRELKMERMDLISIVLLYAFLILGIVTGIKKLFKYNGLFENLILHASLSIQLHALVYIIELILYCAIIILTIKLTRTFKGESIFSWDNANLLLYISLLIIIYAFITNVSDLLIHVEGQYQHVLNHDIMTSTLLLVIGTFITTVATIYKKSLYIKEEHDLTI
ncbi:DUF2975 domain-containing protein [Staphylococcus sp. IVB6238]|uniref:DUF2975 domain-containing protein n=1 Tax=Staphylococcus sp. IVB6238 TaxID=2989770 RepID=UPI0021D03742|nr:DUF2975 domain-containing protein [Staphylococcus sp. IVB6238]UXR74052.1 DUF2975 domain-containing protein [Staphylococcus sp. IVB6238]